MTASTMPSAPSMADRTIRDWRSMVMFVCVVSMEVLWLAPALQRFLTSSIMEDPLPMPMYHMLYIVGGNALFGLLVRRLLIAARLDFVVQRIPVLLAGIFALLVTTAVLPTLLDAGGDVTFDLLSQFDITQDIVPTGALITPIALLSYSRGSSAGRYPPAPENVTYRGRLGIAVYFFTALASTNEMQSEMAVLLPLFFTSMLLASAMSRAATLKLSSEARRRHLSGSWFGFLVFATLLVVFVSILVTALLGGVDEDQVRAILAIPFTVVIGVLVILFTPVGYVLSYVIGQLEISDEATQPEETFEGTRETPPSADNPQIDISDELEAIVAFVGDSVLFFVMAFAIGLTVLFWITVFLMPDSQQLDDEESEDIGNRESIGNIAGALGNQLKKLGQALNAASRFGLGRDMFAAFTVRWAYGRMEFMGKRRGFARVKSQTPYEYESRLHQAFPGGSAAVHTITNAYVAIRYGELPENETELNAVREALDHLKTIEPPKTSHSHRSN